MDDNQLYSGASWDFNRVQKNDNDERLETIKLKNEFFNDALTDLINESNECGE